MPLGLKVQPHVFEGRLDHGCTICNQPDRSPIHLWPPITEESTIEAERDGLLAAMRQLEDDLVKGGPILSAGEIAEMLQYIRANIELATRGA